MKRLSFLKLGLIWIVALMLLTMAGLFIDIPVAKPGDFEGFQNYLDKAIPDYMAMHHIPAVAVGLIHNGEVVYLKGYGFADTEQSIPVTEETVFQAASISKSLTAWGIMKLVEEGKLELDEPVSNYLTRWELPTSEFDANGVTIRRLLSHTAGIANVGGGYAGFDPSASPQTLEESLTSAKDANGEGVRIVYQPGTRHEYSGGGYTLLQLVIEEVTHLPFETYMKNEILEPLGMHQSSFALDPALEENLSVVYDVGGSASPSRLFTAKAAAGLYTTARDLSSWAVAMMPSDAAPQGRGVLKPETVQAMFLPQPEARGLSSDGLGYDVGEIYFTNLTEVYHTGTNEPGWCSVVSTVPMKGEGLVLLTNAPGGAALRHEIRSTWLFWVTGGSTFALRLQKLVNLLKVILPVGIGGGAVLFITWMILKVRGKSS
jgi:D-alanyl-D-alanine carboxypeptidase